ncbi:ankyrin repeat-containing domain, PGG domain protein [Tanacetum coccineum]
METEMGQEASVPLSIIIEQSPQNDAIQIHLLARSGRRALLVAASARRTPRGAQFVNKLVVEMEEAQLELKDNSGNTALCLAAINGNLEVVEIMVAKHKALLSMPDWEGMMPLCKAALSGRYDVVKYLFDKSDGLRSDGWDAKNRAWLFQKCVEGDMFDNALQILTEHIELANDEELLRILARKPDAFVKKSSNFHWKIVIWEMGNTKFIVELICQYGLIFMHNKSDQSIFHIAVEHRHEGIYNLLYDRSPPDVLTLLDKDGNNMVHLVGKIEKAN